MSRTGPIVEEVPSSDDEFFDSEPKKDPEPVKAEAEEKKTSSEFDDLVKKRTGRNDVSEDAVLTPEEIEVRTAKAEEKKTLGNKLYQDKDYNTAIMTYTEGIELYSLFSQTFILTEILLRAPPKSQIKSVLFGNRAACYLVLEDFKRVVEDCDKSLEIDDKYSKVYLRRAQAHKKLNDFRSSLKDYEKVIELMKDEAPAEARRAVKELAPLAKKQEEEEKEKMIGELKNLGNKFLGLFGLSLDNFQMQQDPKSGSYSVNFNQGGGAAQSAGSAPASDPSKPKEDSESSGED